MPRLRHVLVAVIYVAGGVLALAPAAYADVLGESHSFNTSSVYDVSGSPSISATARAVTQQAYFYIDDRYWGTLSDYQRNQFTAALNQIALRFDTEIYPKATAFWGSEARPGVDGDPRATILMEGLAQGTGGYFQTINNYSVAAAPGSNAREMIYIGVDSVLNGTAKDFLAHEFQHLISFNQKEILRNVGDDVWLNEARSEYDITVAGYSEPFEGSTLQRRVQAFLRTPSDSLVDWPNTSVDYAIASVFVHYLTDRYGPDILASTIRSFHVGIPAIEEWLSGNGRPERFADVFTDWMVASVINDRSGDIRYGYARQGLMGIHVPYQEDAPLSVASSYGTNLMLRDWQPIWLKLTPTSDTQLPAVNIQLSGPTGPWFGGAYIASYESGQRIMVSFSARAGQATLSISTHLSGSRLLSVVLAVAQGISEAVGDRHIVPLPVTISASVGPLVPTTADVGGSHPLQLQNGDLIRRPGQAEVYVTWDSYRRYLSDGVLALYGFQNRPVTAVADDIFNRYTTSNYVRAVDGTKVYALWPDGTKHWLRITPAQWDASGRDWGAIFIVNDAEVAFYKTGSDITQ